MKRIISVLLAVLILSSVFVMPASAASSQYAEGKYADEFEQYLINCGYGPYYEGNNNWYMYSELYEYFSEDNTSQTPDWVLVNGCTNGMSPSFCDGVFGEYHILVSNWYTPYSLRYHIYIPEQNKFYTLSVAWTERFEGIEKAFTEYLVPNELASLVEDADGDGVITAYDASKYNAAAYNSFEQDKKNIYFDATNSGWEDFEKVYCTFKTKDGSVIYAGQTQYTECTNLDGDSVFRYDVNNITDRFKSNAMLEVTFSNENGDTTAPLYMASGHVGGTVYFTGEFADNNNKKPVISWTKEADFEVPALKSCAEELEYMQGILYGQIETNRYYFLMPNGHNGVYYFDNDIVLPEMDHQDIIDKGYGYFAPSWFNKYTDTAGIWWWSNDFFKPNTWPGYAMEKTQESDIFYADVPKEAVTLMFNNTVDAGMDYNSPLREYEKFTNDVAVCGYEPFENELYPEGIESFDNMIFVLDPSYKSAALSDREERACNGDWYYYYGDGCYGTEKDGRKKADCLRWDHNHKWLSEGDFYLVGDEGLCGADWDTTDYQNMLDLSYKSASKTFELTRSEVKRGIYEYAIYADRETEVVKGSVNVKYDHARVRIVYDPYENTVKAEVIPLLHFDTTTTNWTNFTKVYCHIWEKEGDSFYGFQSVNSRCADDDGDGIWTYDLEAKNIKLEEGKTYGVIFSNEKMFQTTALEFDTELLGDTVYVGEIEGADYANAKVGTAYWRSQPRKMSAHQALIEYERKTGEDVETNRYYFLMPNGSNGEKGDDDSRDEEGNYIESYGKFAESWYNEYTDCASVYWWESEHYYADLWPGYTMYEDNDYRDVYYADVPKDVKTIIFNNNVDGGFDETAPIYKKSAQTYNIPCEYYDPGESPNYPDGTESFDNMIFVVDPDYITVNDLDSKRTWGGEWYYYYGNGCYGLVKDGKTADCIRDDHDHSDRFLHFDANTTNWRYYEKIYCHIWEYGGEPFYNWQQRAELCTDNDGDGIWTYDLAEKGIELEEGKQYAVIFSNENQYQTYNLLFDTTVIGDTAYCDGTRYENPEGTFRNPEFAYWRNQDDSKAGPELQITNIGEVTGTCIPKGKTTYGLFKDFLENKLEYAQRYSGKTDQQLLDDLSKALKLSADDVERAIKETGIKNVEWKHPDKKSVKDAIAEYEEQTGEKVDTIRYYFLMPNGKNGQRRTDTVGGNPFASSWYNTYADKPGVYWWDVKSYDPPVFPGYYPEKSDSKDVYYADLPKDVKEVIWNNFVFTSMDTIDDPMYAYSCHTKETVLPHHIYSSMPNEEPNFIYVVDPDTEITSEFSGNKTIDGNWYYYYGNGCYGETYGGECIRGDHDHTIRDTYIVAGVEALCGSSWDLFDTSNQMTFNKKTGAYEITYTDVPVGNHEFMVTKNFEFGPITPGNPDYNEAKVTVDGSIVKITYTEGVGVDVEVTPPLLGDVDGDGVISIMDATEIQLAVAKKITLTQKQEKYADTDFDGEVSVMDATAIQLFVAKKITEFK